MGSVSQQENIDGKIDASVQRAGLFAIDTVARIVNVPTERLRNWDRLGIACASVIVRGKRYYGFQDLLGVRRVKALVDHGVPMRRIRKAVEGMRSCGPAQDKCLSDISFGVVGKDIVARDESGPFDAMSGQMIMAFDEPADGTPVIALRTRAPEQQRQKAYEHYLRGCRYDETENDIELAEAAYRDALSFDPNLPCAHTNLGNCCYRRGLIEEAIEHFETALRLDAEQPEALYNLGFLLYETGIVERSVQYFQRALDSDPSFVDAHVSLAMAYEELGQNADAVAHWESSLALQPNGPWTAYAQERLAQHRRPD